MNNKKIRKTLYILLSAAIFFTLMSMGKNSGSAGKSVKLQWYTVGARPADADLVLGEVNKYLAQQGEDYTIDYDGFGYGGELNQKMNLVIKSGEPADIIFQASDAGNFFSNAANGYLTELDGMLDKFPALKAKFPKSYWDSVRINGKIYSIPYAPGALQYIIGFKGTTINDLGLDTSNVKTWADLAPIFEAVHKVYPTMILFDTSAHRIRADYPFGEGFPIALSFAEPEKGFQVLPDIKAYQDLSKLKRDWYEKGYIAEDAVVAAKESPYRPKSFTNWFVRATAGGPGVDVYLRTVWGDDITIQPIIGTGQETSNMPKAAMLSIPSSSTHKEQALSFINRLNTDVYIRNLIGRGIEGIHYNKVGVDAEGNPVIEQTKRGKTDYNPPNYAMGGGDLLYVLKGMPLDLKKQQKAAYEASERSPALGFSFDPVSIQQDLATAQAISKPYIDSLRFGVIPIDSSFAEWRQKLRNAGWYDVVDTINKAYMEWKQKQ